VLALYGIMDVVAVPSQFEGFGLSAAEAMAAGRPVVGTRVGGLAEIIEDGVTGYLISPDDSTGFAAALVRVLSDPHEAAIMGQRGRKRVSEQFSSKRFAESFVEAYRYFMTGGSVSGDAARRPPLVP
jgi:glycosyltransferase involved in cell wall biosynthesis